MPKPMTPAARARLQAASDFLLAEQQAQRAADWIIAGLVGQHGASFRTGADTNRLSCAGVAATCTWSSSDGLLAAWRRLATLRLMENPA
jgi:hypothetical protein